MISNPEVIHYACIARSTTILAHHNATKDPNIETLASQCIAQTPPHHSLFSHTLHGRTYTFLIHPPFVFFAISTHQPLSFLTRIKSAFLQSQSDVVSPHFPPFSFQSQFDSILRDALDLHSESSSNSSRGGMADGDCGNPSADSVKGTVPLLGKPPEGLKKKKRVVGADSNGGIDGKDSSLENKVDLSDDVNSFAVVNDHHRQKAKHVWKKHVWVVLMLDLFVCAVLFVIWLWVCSGFKCMAY